MVIVSYIGTDYIKSHIKQLMLEMLKSQMIENWQPKQVMLRTDSEADLLLLIGQSIIVVEVKLQIFVLTGQQLHLQAEQHTEVAFTAHHPDGVMGSLQVGSYLS